MTKHFLILGPLFALMSACGSGGRDSASSMPASVRRTAVQQAAQIAQENGFPSGSKIYGSDLVIINFGKTHFVPATTSTIARSANGGFIVKDHLGKVVRLFPSTATLTIEHDGRTQSIRPNQSVPLEYKNARALEILK